MGCPRQHKSYARYPTRQGGGLSIRWLLFCGSLWGQCYIKVTPKMASWLIADGGVASNLTPHGQTAKCRHGRFQMVNMTAICRHPDLPFSRMAFLPLFSGVVSLTPRWRSWRSIPFGRSFSCQGQKRSRYIDAPTPAGAFLSLGFLCGCLCTGSIAVFS